MAFTSIKNEPARIEKELQQSTGTGRYMLDTPGQGTYLPMQNCPFIRMQKWGANYSPNILYLENELRGMNMPLNRDEPKFKYKPAAMKKPDYPSAKAVTGQSRAVLPAWIHRDQELNRWDYPFENLQNHSYRTFANNISSRIDVKNKFMQ